MTLPIVELENVTKRYRDLEALSGVSFHLREGEVFGYLGPNGAGKTTTLKILAGLLTKFEGKVRVDGKSLPDRRDEVHDSIGFLPQSAGFQEWRTTESALRSFGLLSGVPVADLDHRVDTWLERFELTKSRSKKIKTLSGGMVQKLGLIQALLHEPKLLILDEPLAGLDPTSRQLVKDVVRERRAAGTTVIFSSHILSDVQDVADRIGILHAGRLLACGSIDDMKAELPVEVGVEFSSPPTSTEFLLAHPSLIRADEESANQWVLKLQRDTDTDRLIHYIVETTLRSDGRLRRIGTLEPNLDELYTQYISVAEEATEATEAGAKATETPASGR